MEIFSDEARFRCRQCGQYVYREKAPSCMEWCPSARQCLGEERWQELMGSIQKESGQSSSTDSGE